LKNIFTFTVEKFHPMQSEINPFNLKRNDQVYYLGDLAKSVGDKPNPTAGWGTITDIIGATAFSSVKVVVDMGFNYPAADRIKILPYYCFKHGPLQQFKTVEQMEVERQEKNNSLNEFYKGINRIPIALSQLQK
jgi:hypothetical protein